MYTCRSDGGLHLFHSFMGLVLFPVMFFVSFLLDVYTFWGKKKGGGVPADVISKPYSALVWAVLGGRSVTRGEPLFPSAGICTDNMTAKGCYVGQGNEKLAYL